MIKQKNKFSGFLETIKQSSKLNKDTSVISSCGTITNGWILFKKLYV